MHLMALTRRRKHGNIAMVLTGRQKKKKKKKKHRKRCYGIGKKAKTWKRCHGID